MNDKADDERANTVKRHANEATQVIRRLDDNLKGDGYRVRDADIRWGDGGACTLTIHIGKEFRRVEWTIWARCKTELNALEAEYAAKRLALIDKAMAIAKFHDETK